MSSYKERKQKLRQKVKEQQKERIRKIQQNGYQFKKIDAFRTAEKKYKFYQHINTDFSELLDPTTLESIIIDNKNVYIIPEPKGAFLIKNFIDVKTQYQIGFQALNDYIRKPYRTNLDGTNGLYLNEQKKEIKNQESQNNYYGKQEQSQEMIQQKKQIKSQETQSNNEKGYFFNEKIRMANLGYQYDWPHRSYPKTQVPIPQTIIKLTTKARDFCQNILKKQNMIYHGEAVIVNFYKPKDYMIGHLDDGQQDQINPIFSYCLGLSCVFLLGFPDKNIKPVAIKLQAGDLLIMSDFSRICYHGVPRIIEQSYSHPEQNEQTEKIKKQIDSQKDNIHRFNGYDQIGNYFKSHRLNVNIRQVWARKQQVVKQH